MRKSDDIVLFSNTEWHSEDIDCGTKHICDVYITEFNKKTGESVTEHGKYVYRVMKKEVE